MKVALATDAQEASLSGAGESGTEKEGVDDSELCEVPEAPAAKAGKAMGGRLLEAAEQPRDMFVFL